MTGTKAKEKILYCWSGGKDSMMGLHALEAARRAEITSLLTTVTADYDRVSMHGFRRSLLREQAASLGLPLYEIALSKNASNEEYEAKMAAAMDHFRSNDVTAVAFGDIFLEDLKRYREEKLAKVGLKAVFPIWKQPTERLARKFIELGYRAVVTCVDTDKLDGAFAGRMYDRALLGDLPESVDPCGENGEFHTFVFEGPRFSVPIRFDIGRRVLREKRFMFCDLVPSESGGDRRSANSD